MPSKRSRTGQPARPTTSYAEWKARAEVKLEHRHGGKASTIPARLWARLYVRNLSPEAAAAEAATSAYKHPPGFRAHAQAMTDELPFKVVRSNGTDEVLAVPFTCCSDEIH